MEAAAAIPISVRLVRGQAAAARAATPTRLSPTSCRLDVRLRQPRPLEATTTFSASISALPDGLWLITRSAAQRSAAVGWARQHRTSCTGHQELERVLDLFV
jgi:hypothetical protein